MKTNQELFDKHFSEYKEWVISNKKFPTTTNDDKFEDGTQISSWRANHKGKIVEFENSMRKLVTNRLLGNKQIEQDQRMFDKAIKYQELYPWEPKTLEEYLYGNNRYHFYSIDTYITIMKYINESLNDLGWLLLYKTLFGDNGINSTYIGNKDKWAMFKKVSINVFKTLTDRENQAICLRFGLNDGDQKTYDKIGQELNVTHERIRQIVFKVIRKLYHPSRSYQFRILDNTHDDQLAPTRGIGHWFIFCYDGKKTVVKRNISELEESLEQEELDYTVPFGSYAIGSVKSYTHYGYQIDSEIRLIIDELLLPSSNYQIFNYTVVYVNKLDPIKTVREYVDEYHQDIINEKEKQELLLEHRTKVKELKEEAERIVNTYQSSMFGNQSMFSMWSKKQIQDVEDQETTLFKNEFPPNLAKIVNSLIIDEDHTWVDKFNESVRKYFIPTGCCAFTANTLKKCLDAKLHDYTIEVLFSAPSDIDQYLHIKFISDIS